MNTHRPTTASTDTSPSLQQFLSFAKQSRDTINTLLKHSLQQNLPTYRTFGTLAEQAYRVITEFTCSGKMLRGTLVQMSYNGYTNHKPQNTHRDAVNHAACALELLQSFLLIHDDIMDNSSLRRKKPTVHKQFSTYCSEVLNLSHNEQSGISLAICTGDICFAMSSQALNTALSLNQQSEQYSAAIRNLFYHEVVRVGIAQMDDIVLSNPHRNPSSQTILNLYEQKTGYYSIVLPLTIGVYLASATQDIKLIEQIGKNIGVIFQIKDDLIDITDSTITGKQAAIDITNNKYTYPRQLLVEYGGETVIKQLIELELSNDDDIQKINVFRSLCEQYGVLEYIDRFVTKLADSANNQIDTLAVPNTAFKEQLFGFVQYCLHRTS